MNWSNNTILREFAILSKREWLEKKEEFKKIKQELQTENKDLFQSCFKQSNEDINSIRKGTLIILKDLPEKINKNDIKIWVSHFIEPAYVDYNNHRKECIVRFSHAIFADSFLNKFNEENERKINDEIIQIEKMEGEEEEKYISKVENLMKDFGNKKQNKKVKLNLDLNEEE